jgi:hypothetical protein
VPFLLPEGVQQLGVKARDVAGNSTAGAAGVRTDLTPPVPTVGAPAPQPLLLPGATTTLRFDVTDALSATVRVRVFVYNVLDNLVRTLDVPGAGDGYRPAGAGAVTWDGRNDAGKPVLPGLYEYRVEAIDEAGNTASSTESAQFLVAVAGLPGH